MTQHHQMLRRLPVGAEVHPAGGVHFRVWAPRRRSVEVMLEEAAGATGAPHRLGDEGNGYWSGHVAAACAGSRYRYRLDEGPAYPDPASRFQPDGPHGPSQVVDPTGYRWSDRAWRGLPIEGQVLYEMHVGTFTREGTWAAAARELPALASLGITVLELMPVAEFPGRWGWGYDGVSLFAPTRLYGTPDDFRAFVDRAHGHGMAVILDVVYNHLGPDGAYHREFSPRYFTDRYENEWGDPLNFDGEESGPVREFFVGNAGYWVDEFHVDGLRLDATQQIFDASEVHVMQELTQHVRKVAGERRTLVIAENEPQHARLVRPLQAGGHGMDGIWNDDFHHSATVAATGHNEAYYTDYLGSPQEFVSMAKHGFLYQGQRYKWQSKRRGLPARDLPPAAFVTYLQNHDQVANSDCGLRLHQLASPGRYRALTALWLLMPGTPMFFQGQEFAASSPFLFFADHKPELARAVVEGRKGFLRQFPRIATPEVSHCLPDPGDPETFRRCILDHEEREAHAWAWALHRDLLRLRREEPAFRAARRGALDGAVLAEEAFVLRFFAEAARDERLLVVNLGRDVGLYPSPEPLLAPLEGHRWAVAWSSEHPDYQGHGCPPVETEQGWRLPGQAAVVLRPEPEPPGAGRS